MLRRKDFVPNTKPPLLPAEYSGKGETSTRARHNEFVCPSSKRIKTEPCYDQNTVSIDTRLAEIRDKYQRRDTTRPLAELRKDGFRNIDHVQIKEVDSPISCLKRSSFQNNYFTTKDNRQNSTRHHQNFDQYHSKQKDVNQVGNIDTINQKIRSILKTIEGNDQTPSQPDRLAKKGLQLGALSNKFDHQFANPLRKMEELRVPQLDTYQRLNSKMNSYRDLLTEAKGNPSVGRQTAQDYKSYPQRESLRIQPSMRVSTIPTYQTILPENRLISNNVFNVLESRQSIVQNDSFEESIVVNKHGEDDQGGYATGLSDVARMYRPRRRVVTETSRDEYDVKATKKVETELLYSRLRRQVELDQQYRNKKYAYKQIRDEMKLDRLADEIRKLGWKSVNKEQLRTEMVVTEEEYNPFYTCREDGDYRSIATAYVEAHQHWQECIVGKFSYKKLSEEGFCTGVVDLERKGYLTVEDFVRLLNIEAETFVRNRDLVLIYRRLGGQRVLFSTLIKHFCRQQ